MLDPFQPSGQRLVMDQGQPQGFTRNRLFNLQLIQCLRNGRRTDHFVLDAVPQRLFIDRERHPPHDIGESRFSQDVRHAVGHPKIGTDRSIECPLEHGKHVGRGSTDIHADQV